MFNISADDCFADTLIQNTNRFCVLHGLNVSDKGRANFLIFIILLAKKSLRTTTQSHVCVYYSFKIQIFLSTVIEQCIGKRLVSLGNDKAVALRIQGTSDLEEVRRSHKTGVYTDNIAGVE